VREALRLDGVGDAPAHVMAYRSAWNVRILVSNRPWAPADIAALKKFCDDRSFDVSWYPGIDIVAARANIYNDLPAVSFAAGQVTSGGGAHDAIADEAEQALTGQTSLSQEAFRLTPITMDRPFYYDILRIGQLGTILKRLEILPQAEIAQLVNLAVLAQAIVIAALVLLVPFLSRGRVAAPRSGLLRPVVYFSVLGLGFLFIEIFLIEKASFYLNDRTSAFALVLTGMLVFAGLGSLLADRAPERAAGWVAGAIVVWCGLVLAGLQPLLLATLDLPFAARAALMLAVIAPGAVALGMPFPLGLRRAAEEGGGFLPWAWGLNGALSVVATPLANLLAVQMGFQRVLLCAALLYVVSWWAYPSARKSFLWQNISVS
jgi:hypothetical protein